MTGDVDHHPKGTVMSDHVTEARKHIEWAHDNQAEMGEFEFNARDNAMLAQAEALLAQAEAMRALAEQQRIANLLTLMGSKIEVANDMTITNTEAFAMEVRESVLSALGFESWSK